MRDRSTCAQEREHCFGVLIPPFFLEIKMTILDGWTLIVYGYNSGDSRCRRVIITCDGCGEVRDVSKYNISPLCMSCSKKLDNLSDETRYRLSNCKSGMNNPNFGNVGEKSACFGRTHTSGELERMSETHSGEKNHMFGKTTPPDVRDRISASLSGENHPNYGKRGKDTTNWQGGLTDTMQALRNTPSYKNWRESVYERDDHTCQECGARSSSGNPVYLNAHHIDPIKDNRNTLLIFDVNNGITLCEGCHNVTKGHEEDFIDRYAALVSA